MGKIYVYYDSVIYTKTIYILFECKVSNKAFLHVNVCAFSPTGRLVRPKWAKLMFIMTMLFILREINCV